MNKLDAIRKKVGLKSAIGAASTAAQEKLDEYYALAKGDKQIQSTVATVCDFRSNLRVFDQIWPAANQA